MDWTNIDNFIADSPGAVWDKDHAQEIKDNLSLVNFEVVSGTFASTTGVAVALTDKGNALYGVTVTIIGTGTGDIGEISVVRTSATSMTVYNTGSNTTATFTAIVFPVATP